MRTTVTLDPETEHLIREAMRQRGQSFKEVLNRAVVQGLADLRPDAGEAPFVPITYPMGLGLHLAATWKWTRFSISRVD